MMPRKRDALILDRDYGYEARFIARHRVKIDSSAGFFVCWPWTGRGGTRHICETAVEDQAIDVRRFHVGPESGGHHA